LHGNSSLRLRLGLGLDRPGGIPPRTGGAHPPPTLRGSSLVPAMLRLAGRRLPGKQRMARTTGTPAGLPGGQPNGLRRHPPGSTQHPHLLAEGVDALRPDPLRSNPDLWGVGRRGGIAQGVPSRRRSHGRQSHPHRDTLPQGSGQQGQPRGLRRWAGPETASSTNGSNWKAQGLEPLGLPVQSLYSALAAVGFSGTTTSYTSVGLA